MIQRIQSLYLLASAVLTGLMLKMPLLKLTDAMGNIYAFKANGVFDTTGQSQLVYAATPLFIMLVVIGLITLFALFSFKKRVLQIRLSIYNIILLVGFYGVWFFFYKNFQTVVDISATSYQVALVFPVISIILHYLALINIRKDEALIKSMNRLR